MGLELVVASSNPGKVAEIREILLDLPVRLITREEMDVWPDAVEELGETYLANALLKARALADSTRTAALGEDSGLECDALDGAPGVLSARFAGTDAAAEDNNRRLASLMEGVPVERRTARYRCVAVVVFPDGEEIASVGTCEGTIATEPRGTGGFGYDPWFIPVGGSRTMAELSPQEKHAISHRGKALRGLAEQLRRYV